MVGVLQHLPLVRDAERAERDGLGAEARPADRGGRRGGERAALVRDGAEDARFLLSGDRGAILRCHGIVLARLVRDVVDERLALPRVGQHVPLADRALERRTAADLLEPLHDLLLERERLGLGVTVRDHPLRDLRNKPKTKHNTTQHNTTQHDEDPLRWVRRSAARCVACPSRVVVDARAERRRPTGGDLRS